MIHTGDITHLATPQQFDDAAQLIGEAQARRSLRARRARHSRSQDQRGLSRTLRQGRDGRRLVFLRSRRRAFRLPRQRRRPKTNGLGSLGAEQLAWLDADLRGKSNSTPIVVFAHIPLWMIAPEWGWGTEDSAQALQLLARFGSVTVLNGHIHQLMQKVEGAVTFHTARSTAFPQPVPGTAPAPGPKLVPAGELRKYLGVAEVAYVADLGAAGDRRQRAGVVRPPTCAFTSHRPRLSAPDRRRPRPRPPTPTTASSSIRAARTAIRSTRTTSARAIAASSDARRARCRTTIIPTRSDIPASSGRRPTSTNG